MGGISSHATENSTAEITNDGVYLSTTPIPEDAINYAINNVFRYLLARSQEDNFDLNSITMGTPFAMGKENASDGDIYYFPIFSNNQILYTFRVYMVEDGYTGILSPYMAEPLNNYIHATTKSSPLYIYIDNGNVIASLNGSTNILEYQQSGYEPNTSIATVSVNNTDLKVTNILTSIEFKETPLARATSNSITLDMKEQQGNQSWCAAFAMASILRHKGAGSAVTAEAIVKYFHPNSSNLANESVSRDQLVIYAKDKGYSKTTNSASTLSNTSVVSEIDNDTPIYAGCAGSGAYANARHALVICGYNNSSATYTVWNPWYKYTETISQSSKIYRVNASSYFTWDCTIYQIRK